MLNNHNINPQDIFTYELPKERIAQRPVYPYDRAKLLIVNRKTKSIEESTFNKLGNYLKANDRLVFNDSKVIPARFFGSLEDQTRIEILLVKDLGNNTWEVLGKPLKKFKPKALLKFSEKLQAQVIERLGDKFAQIQFQTTSNEDINSLIQETGCMPIPPYIRSGHGDTKDLEDYQTFFAKNSGSVAAPTASLHFTPELLAGLEKLNIKTSYLTLHVGTASFLPIFTSGQISVNQPGKESFSVSSSAMTEIESTKKSAGKVIAVGTTVVRALEASALNYSHETDLFITPGFDFKACSAVITNFHQPGTTHLCLVQALLGKELLARCYQYALDHDFRFLSYGDGMLIL